MSSFGNCVTAFIADWSFIQKQSLSVLTLSQLDHVKFCSNDPEMVALHSIVISLRDILSLV